MQHDAHWRSLFARLLDEARLGAQFPDVTKWRALLDVLGREGPRGRPLKVSLEPSTGLPTARQLVHLHRLQFIAREFFKTVRQRPSREARAFSMVVAALELPPVSATTARLMSPGRFLLVHERLDERALRFTLVVEQGRRGPISLGKDQLAHVSPELAAAVRAACRHGARAAFLGLSRFEGLVVKEVVRGELGPLVSGAWTVPDAAPPDVRALREVCTGRDDGVLSVTLERLAADVAQRSVRDPWATPEAPLAGLELARERRLFCTPQVVERVRALVGRQVLVRAHA